jgi:prevent-host-death family protein
MSVTTISSREFNQDTSKAKTAANSGPVIITDRGQPAHVLLSFADFKKLSKQTSKIADFLAMDKYCDEDFVTPKLVDLPRPAEF